MNQQRRLIQINDEVWKESDSKRLFRKAENEQEYLKFSQDEKVILYSVEDFSPTQLVLIKSK